MDSKQCAKCNEIKPVSQFYIRKRTRVEDGVAYKCMGYQSKCKECKKLDYTPKQKCRYVSLKEACEKLDKMIEFAQSLGFKSASYAIDKYGKEQFKNMYYENKIKDIQPR